ncbi:MAG TPA: hypothetical protein VK183_14190, partial [Flavobacterium sp.]|nr:hypothetical protein [Flavobacterium sp.]
MKKHFLSLLLLTGLTLFAQENLTFQKPSAEILALADYQRAPSVTMDSKKEWMLLSYRDTYKSLEDLNQEEMRLGGLRINPVTHISSATTFINNLKVRRIAAKEEIQVAGLPRNPRITNLSWSPDETKIAFTNTVSDGTELWVLDVASAKATRLTGPTLNAVMGNPISWFRDGKALLVNVLPTDRPALVDSKKDLPKGPTVSVSDGSKSQNRTYPDLLKNATDEANFETLVRSELQRIALDGSASVFKPADLYAGVNFSPDGSLLMVTTIRKPYSYIVPVSRFPMQSDIYDLSGRLVKTVNEVPLNEVMPKGFMAVRKGKRSMGWRADEPATLSFVEALDGGDPANQVEFRDEVFLWKAPFDAAPVSLVKLKQRYGGMLWGNATTAMVTEEWYDTRNEKAFLIDPSKPGAAPRLVSDRNSQDIYSDPGQVETVRNAYGRYVMAIENGNVFLIGDGFTKEGQFP